MGMRIPKPGFMLKNTLLLFLIFSMSNISCQSEKSTPKKPNILFIAVDDLRPELGAYGNSIIHSPNIDRLAKQGILFRNHYVNVPTCGASRYALLTGRFPQNKKEVSNKAFHEMLSGLPEREEPESFVHHLKRNSYYTVGLGKITHYVDGRLMPQFKTEVTGWELPHSWDEMLLDAGKWKSSWGAFFGYADGGNRNDQDKNVPPYEDADVSDEGYPDGLTANLAIKKLKELKDRDEPFFLGVGFFKPHLPFNAPKKYWDLYKEEDIPLSPNPDIPVGIHKASLHGSGEFNQYKKGLEKASLDQPLSDAYARRVKHGYYACVSYTDALVGKVLAALEEHGLAENTIVVLWGDHGWNLGDQRVWGKHTVFERSLHSPLIIKMPGSKYGGKQVEEIVSTTDIYPTLLGLSGVTSTHPLDGRNLEPLITSNNTDWDNKAYSFFKNRISLRTERYRISQYYRKAEPKVELFDHETDPLEQKNIAADHPTLTDSLLVILQKGNKGLFPYKD